MNEELKLSWVIINPYNSLLLKVSASCEARIFFYVKQNLRNDQALESFLSFGEIVL